MTLSSIIEALLIASNEALTTKKIVSLLRKSLPTLEEKLTTTSLDSLERERIENQISLVSKLSNLDIEKAIKTLNTSYESLSFNVLLTNSGWRIHTKPEYSPYLEQLFPDEKPKKLSQSAIETLAIIAYRQPSSKADIEAIRGVASDSMIQKLLKYNLIKEAGRSERLGRPLVYEVTPAFHTQLGVSALTDLPNYKELSSSIEKSLSS